MELPTDVPDRENWVVTFPWLRLVPSGATILVEIARTSPEVVATSGVTSRLAGMMMNHWESGGFLGVVFVPMSETV